MATKKYTLEWLDLNKSYNELKKEWYRRRHIYKKHKEYAWDNALHINSISSKLNYDPDMPVKNVILCEKTNRKRWYAKWLFDEYIKRHWENSITYTTIIYRINAWWDDEKILREPYNWLWWHNKGTWLKRKREDYKWDKITYSAMMVRIRKWEDFETAISPRRRQYKWMDDDGRKIYW